MLLTLTAPGTIKLAWDPSTPSNLVGGYHVHYGTTSGNYTQQVDVGNTTTATISGLSNTIYYFAVSAYGINNTILESGMSNEVSANLTTIDLSTILFYSGTEARYDISPAFVLLSIDAYSGAISPPFNLTTVYSFFSTNTIPTDVAKDRAVTLGLKFATTSAGSIVGYKFYTGALGKQTFTFGLYDDKGVLLKKKQITTNLKSPGWVKDSLANAIAISANKVYTAAYFTPVGFYAHKYYDLSSSIKKGPLYTITDGNNGVYNYNPQLSFPKSSSKSSNYFVDISFVF